MSDHFDDFDDDDGNIDLTPLIDAVFLLLIFFITTTTFIRPSVTLALPQASSAKPSEDRRAEIVFAVDAKGAVHHKDRTVTRTDVRAIIAERPEARINLHVDKAAPFDAFMSVLDEAKLLGKEDVAVTTLPTKN